MESIIATYNYRSRPIENVIAFYSYISDNMTKVITCNAVRFVITLLISAQIHSDWMFLVMGGLTVVRRRPKAVKTKLSSKGSTRLEST